MKTNDTKQISIIKSAEETADIFVIPNTASTYAEFGCFKWKYFHWLKRCLKANEIELNDKQIMDEMFVQIWFRTPECQDATSTGIVIKMDKSERHYTRPNGFLPYILIKDMREGDTKEIIIPMQVYVNGINEDDCEAQYELNVKWIVKANQNEYRYRNFGPFEKALEIVTNQRRERNKEND